MDQRKQYKQFQIVDADGFTWEGEYFRFDAIRHLFFTLIKTTQRQVFLKVGEPEEAHIIITLIDGRTIHLYFDERTILFGINTNKQKDIDNLKKLCAYLLERSFEYRLAHYLRELEQKGFFEYDECRFYPKEKTIFFRNEAFPLATSRLIKFSGYVELKKKGMTFMDKLRWELSPTKVPQFNTQTDPDVIVVLLRNLFGLQME